MSSWFWLNTETKKPCWVPLEKGTSNYIETQYENGEPRQLGPFYLPSPSKINNFDRKIRLIPDVRIAMAIECYYNYPLINITNNNQNNRIFGYYINLKQPATNDDEEENINNHINMDLITQKILMLNQQFVTTEDDKWYSRKDEDDKWYCLGIGNIKNIWYPFDLFINQQIDEHFNKKEMSFKLEAAMSSLNIRFESNSFRFDIPFGFATKINSNKNEHEELLIIKYRFDFLGLINGLNVALYPLNFSEENKNNNDNKLETQSDCNKLCKLLYCLFEEETDIEIYNRTRTIIMELNLDGIKVSEWMKNVTVKKYFAKKIAKQHKILKGGPAAIFAKSGINKFNIKYSYNYNVYMIADIMCNAALRYRTHGIIRQCIIKNKYTIDSIISGNDSNQVIANMVHILRDSFLQYKRTKDNKIILLDDHALITEIKKTLINIKHQQQLLVFGYLRKELEGKELILPLDIVLLIKMWISIDEIALM